MNAKKTSLWLKYSLSSPFLSQYRAKRIVTARLRESQFKLRRFAPDRVRAHERNMLTHKMFAARPVTSPTPRCYGTLGRRRAAGQRVERYRTSRPRTGGSDARYVSLCIGDLCAGRGMPQDILVEHYMCPGLTPRAAARRNRGSASGRDEGLRWTPLRHEPTVPRAANAFRRIQS